MECGICLDTARVPTKLRGQYIVCPQCEKKVHQHCWDLNEKKSDFPGRCVYCQYVLVEHVAEESEEEEEEDDDYTEDEDEEVLDEDDCEMGICFFLCCYDLRSGKSDHVHLLRDVRMLSGPQLTNNTHPSTTVEKHRYPRRIRRQTNSTGT